MLADGRLDPYIEDYMNTFYSYCYKIPFHQRTQKMIDDAFIAARNQMAYPEYARIKFNRGIQ